MRQDPTKVLSCLKHLDTSLKACFRNKDDAMTFLQEQGAIFNLNQVFSFFSKGRSSSNDVVTLWTQIEVRVLILCFDLFAYIDPDG